MCSFRGFRRCLPLTPCSCVRAMPTSRTTQATFNLRTALKPQLRALCKRAQAVGVMVDWCRGNDLSFAVRCGGHSYEGLSQSTSVVIDLRLMNAIAVDPKAGTATVGAGASLGSLYRAIAAHGLAFTGGSCPTVGISGHLLGGGYGYLARPYGLACDSLLSAALVNPDGKQVRADAHQNTDLYGLAGAAVVEASASRPASLSD